MTTETTTEIVCTKDVSLAQVVEGVPFRADAEFQECPGCGRRLVFEDSIETASHELPQCSWFSRVLAMHYPSASGLRVAPERQPLTQEERIRRVITRMKSNKRIPL